MEKELLKQLLKSEKRVMVYGGEILEMEEITNHPKKIILDLSVLLKHEEIIEEMEKSAVSKVTAIFKKQWEDNHKQQPKGRKSKKREHHETKGLLQDS